MIVDFEGRAWEFSREEITLKQAFVIQAYTGLSIGEWEDSIDVEQEKDADGKPTGYLVNPPPEWLKSIAALYWLMRAQNGIQEPIAEVDFKFAAFLGAFVEALAAEVARQKAAKPDPTAPPPSPAAPVSPAPSTLPATTQMLPVPPEGAAAIAFTLPATLPG